MTDTSNETQAFAEAVAEGMYELDNAARSLGIEITEISPGRADARMTVREDMLNSHGTCHGGMIFALADTAFAYACNTANRSTVALSCSISFVAPGKGGEVLMAEAVERVSQGRNGIYDITVTGTDRRVVAVFQGNSREVKGESVPGLDARLKTPAQ
jgi:acyl-CoA thioesterase